MHKRGTDELKESEKQRATKSVHWNCW